MAEDDDRQDALIEDLQKKIDYLEKWRIVTLILSGSALLLAVLQMFGLF